MKKELLQIIKTSLLGILTLVLLVLTVLEILPSGQTDLIVKEPITVSPAPVSSGTDRYQLLIMGTLFNDSDEEIAIERLTVTVSGASGKLDVTVPARTLPPRTGYELSYSEISEKSYSSVQAVTATVKGEAITVSNEAGTLLGTVSLLLMALTIVAGFLCYRSALVYSYMQAEKKLPK